MNSRSVSNWKTASIVLGVLFAVQLFAKTTGFFISGVNKIPQEKFLLGKVVDENTGVPLSNVKVIIGSHDGINEDHFHTSEDGMFSFDYDQNKKYVALAAKTSYNKESLFFTPPAIGIGDTLLIKLRRV